MSQPVSSSVSSQGFEYGVKHFYNQKSGLISEILFDTLQLTEEESDFLLKLGAVYINNQRQLGNKRVEENLLFRVHTKPRRYNCDFDWPSRIVFENQDFLILDKPSGIPSHPSVDNYIENSLTQTARARKKELLITHRLDTLTAGLIVYAKTPAFVSHFNVQLQGRHIEKKYVALVEDSGTLPDSVIHYMEPGPRAPKKVTEVFTEGWAYCELQIQKQKKIPAMGLRWAKINLMTGRTHQIRSQLSQLGSPILGDILYGSKEKFNAPGAIALRACELQFDWAGERLHFSLSEEFEGY